MTTSTNRKRSGYEDDYHMFDFASMHLSTNDHGGVLPTIVSTASVVSPSHSYSDENLVPDEFPPMIKRLTFPAASAVANEEQHNSKRQRHVREYRALSPEHQQQRAWTHTQQGFDTEEMTHRSTPFMTNNAVPLHTTATVSPPWWKTASAVTPRESLHPHVSVSVEESSKGLLPQIQGCASCLHSSTHNTASATVAAATAHNNGKRQCSILSFMSGGVTSATKREVAAVSPISSPAAIFLQHMACTHCDRRSCGECRQDCIACLRTFCKGCSIINYDSPLEDCIFCLECHQLQCANESTGDDPGDMEMD
jgi:hypothetical protein